MSKQSTGNGATKRLTTVLLIIYLIAICWILLFKLGVHFSYMEKRSVNLIPFNDHLILTAENILNVLIFVPFGIYAAMLFEKWMLGKKIVFCFLLSLLVEGLQYIFRVGAFDITDIITNTLGGLTGLIIYLVIDKAFNNNARVQKVINIVAAAGTMVIILLLVLLKMNMLPIRYQ
jgi:glycopeptide antibiotics resistance protein